MVGSFKSACRRVPEQRNFVFYVDLLLHPMRDLSKTVYAISLFVYCLLCFYYYVLYQFYSCFIILIIIVTFDITRAIS